ncbi:MAG: beta-ketoacyl synthase chain length factor [Cystobacterineae bacterium]|nr:beta-ketoacyl synthase chain length factor [Cystobacterineae bacterium]
MSSTKFFEGCQVLRYSAWRPTPKEPLPDISFVDARLRRRMSMLSRMSVRVAHGLGPLGKNTSLYFISFRGELNQQFEVNRMLIEEGEISPAAFSLSVFNTPPALSSMALGLHAGYSAVYPERNRFSSALLGAASFHAASSPSKQLVLVYADEVPLKEYERLEENPHSLAFALLLGATPTAKAQSAATQAAPAHRQEEASFSLSTLSWEDCESPQRFLKALEAASLEAAQQRGQNGALHV